MSLVETPELRREIEDFLYSEAELMDSHQYDRWLELWDEEALYWVPCNADEIDPGAHVSLIYERREQLEDRIVRLKGRHAHAQNPKSRLMRVISNVRINDGGAGRIAVVSQFVLGEARLNRQEVWFGRSHHMLARAPSGLRIREKKVILLNNDCVMGNLQFLI